MISTGVMLLAANLLTPTGIVPDGGEPMGLVDDFRVSLSARLRYAAGDRAIVLVRG